jgi:hypothetical protein
MERPLELADDLLELGDSRVGVPAVACAHRNTFASERTCVLPLHGHELAKRIGRALIALNRTRSAC